MTVVMLSNSKADKYSTSRNSRVKSMYVTIQPSYYNISIIAMVNRRLCTLVLRKFSNVSTRLDFGVKSTCWQSVIQNWSRSKLRWKIFSLSPDTSGPSLECKKSNRLTISGHTELFKMLCIIMLCNLYRRSRTGFLWRTVAYCTALSALLM